MIDSKSVERDFRPFADPATDVGVQEGSKLITVTLTRGDLCTFELERRSGRIRVRGEGKTYPSMSSLLASERFANIELLRSTQRRVFMDLDFEGRIPPQGTLDGREFTPQALEEALSPRARRSASKLSILMLDGAAGIGKTSLIELLLVRRANDLGSGVFLPPVLHVTSRGRRLTGLNDALAQSLQSLRADFTYDQVPVLIRHGLLQVAIDGFDELVDPDGYRDAWFALRDFLMITASGGPVILAGRDTFFDQQKFGERLKTLDAEFRHLSLSTIKLQPAKNWLRSQGWSEDEIQLEETDLILREDSYTLRPFFLSVLAEARGWSKLHVYGKTPRTLLIERFITREAALLASKLELGPEVLQKQLISVFEEVAMELATTESEFVDLATLELITELTFDQHLSESDLGKLRHKAGSFGLLVKDRYGIHDARTFPHTEISHQFLAQAILNDFERESHPARTVSMLRRALLGGDFFRIFEETFQRVTTKSARKIVKAIEQLMRQETAHDRLGSNTAGLLLATLSHSIDQSLRSYSGLSATEAVISSAGTQTQLSNATIVRLDLMGADLSDLQFLDCKVTILVVDSTTRFADTNPNVDVIELHGPNGVVNLRSEMAKGSWLRQHSMVADVDGPDRRYNKDAVDLLEWLCRTCMRQHYIKLHPDDLMGRRLVDNRLFSGIGEILKKHQRIRYRKIDASGPPASFVHVVDPQKLLENQPEDSSAQEIWKEVAVL